MKRFHIIKILFVGLILIVGLILWNSYDRIDYETAKIIEDNQIIIRFSSSWAGVDNKAVLIENVIADFEKEYPHVKIINESMYGEDFLFTLKANFASGNGPDVFGLWPGSDLEMLKEKNLLADLSIFLEEDREWSDNFDPKVFEFIDQGDAVYSIPFEVIYEGLYLNLDLFELYDVKVPENYAELLTAIKAFNKVDIIPIAYSLTPEGSFIYQNMIVQLAGKYDSENPIKADGSVKDSYIEAMYYMRHLYQNEAFPENAFTLDDASRNQLFLDKKAAMITQGSWFNNPNFKEDVGVIPFPIGDGTRTSLIYGVGNGNFHVSKHALEEPKKAEATLLFVKYLTSNKVKKMFEVSPSFISTSTDLPDTHIVRLGLELIENADELVSPPDQCINRNFWESVLIKEFPNMLEGKIEPEAIFEVIGDYE